MERVIQKNHSAAKRALIALLAVLGGVLLPQVLHLCGRVAGVGSALGEILLPMHLTVMLAGLLAGPAVGVVAGVCSPVVSYLLTGMPALAMLPFMTVELCAYGAVCGLLYRHRMPVFCKVVLAQIAGRALRAVAIVTANLAFGYTAVPLRVITASIVTGVLGIVLQWVLLPLIVYRASRGRYV